jgi:hypothetical protein
MPAYAHKTMMSLQNIEDLARCVELCDGIYDALAPSALPSKNLIIANLKMIHKVCLELSQRGAENIARALERDEKAKAEQAARVAAAEAKAAAQSPNAAAGAR